MKTVVLGKVTRLNSNQHTHKKCTHYSRALNMKKRIFKSLKLIAPVNKNCPCIIKIANNKVANLEAFLYTVRILNL